jgi:hypothetical protein
MIAMDREARVVCRYAVAAHNLLASMGRSAASEVKRFSELRRRRPGLTAAEFIGASAAVKFADGMPGDPIPSPAGYGTPDQQMAIVKSVLPGLPDQFFVKISDECLLMLAQAFQPIPSAPPGGIDRPGTRDDLATAAAIFAEGNAAGLEPFGGRVKFLNSFSEIRRRKAPQP